MTAFYGLLLAGMWISALLLMMARLNSRLNLRSGFRFLFLKAGLILILAGPMAALFFPSQEKLAFTAVMPIQMASSFTSITASAATRLNSSMTILRWLIIAHLIITFCLIFRLARQLFKLKAFIHACEPVSLSGFADPIFLSSVAKAPFSTVLPKIAIVLPKDEVHSLSSQQLALAIGHETIHIRRKDQFFTIIGAVIKAVWFFWPPVYWINNELEAEMEASCDSELLAQTCVSKQVYGDLLLYFASKSSQIEGLALGVSKTFLYRRILSMKTNPPQARIYTQAVTLATLIVVSSIISVVSIRSGANSMHLVDGLRNQLVCQCEDKTTSTWHELNFRFSTQETASVTMKVMKGPQTGEVCRQTDQKFTVSKLDKDNFLFIGSLNCANQKPHPVRIKFNSSSMTLPNNICHKDTVFRCGWKG